MIKHIPANKSLGKKFGRLTVIEILQETNKHNHKMVKCVCECGKEKIATINRLRNGNVSSCGCLKKERCLKNMKLAYDQGIISGRIKEPRVGTAIRVYKRLYSDGDISFDNFMSLSQKPCFYCNRIPFRSSNIYDTKDNRYALERISEGDFIYNGLDRIDSTLGHTLDNVVPCCLDCNKAKLDRNQNDFFNWIKLVYEFHYR